MLVHRLDLIGDLHRLHKAWYLAEGINLMGEYPAIDDIVHDVYHGIYTIMDASGSEYIDYLDLCEVVEDSCAGEARDLDHKHSMLEYVGTVTYGLELVV